MSFFSSLLSDENTGRNLSFDKHPSLCVYVCTCMSVNLRLDIPDFLPPLLNKRQHPPLKGQSLAQLASLSQVRQNLQQNCITLFFILYYIIKFLYIGSICFLHSVWLLKLPVNKALKLWIRILIVVLFWNFRENIQHGNQDGGSAAQATGSGCCIRPVEHQHLRMRQRQWMWVCVCVYILVWMFENSIILIQKSKF